MGRGAWPYLRGIFHIDMSRKTFALLLGVFMLPPCGADAHVFAQPYTLPVPFSIYAWAATGALLLSFVIVGLFAVAPMIGRLELPRRALASSASGTPVSVEVGRACSLALLMLCVLAGFIGSQNAFVNFNMTFFWIGFVLAVPYAVALIGDFYAAVNPWKTLALVVQSATGISFEGRVRYPERVGYTPGLVLYVIFIWLELFGQLLPRGLSGALAIYTIINLLGAYIFGIRAWFRHGEFFGIFLRLTGKMSPWARSWDPDEPGYADGPRWRLPFVGLLEEPANHLSLVVFILFMLSSTAFDGLHSTLPWVSLYWKQIYPDIAPWLHPLPGKQFQLSTQIYYLWQWFMLPMFPLIYLGVFSVFVWTVRTMTRCTLSVRQLVLDFAMTLVPIAFVYHLTHYYTLLLEQGGQLLRLVSDPFGFGWDLFGTSNATIAPMMLDVGNIWLTQVALIVFGHIVSVYLAHVEALRIFSSPVRAAISQLPMLVLMMVFTNLGLWILSLPIAGG
jgi:hypothetical protein